MTLDVEQLPPRVAHAVYALMVASVEEGVRVPTAAEVCVYDANWEAITVGHTAAALREAQKLGLCATTSGLWVAANRALDQRQAFEERFLRDDAEANGQSSNERGEPA